MAPADRPCSKNKAIPGVRLANPDKGAAASPTSRNRVDEKVVPTNSNEARGRSVSQAGGGIAG